MRKILDNIGIVLKVILYIILAFIGLEIFGAVFNIASVNMKTNSLISYISSTGAERQDYKGFLESYEPNKCVYSQMVIVIYTKDIEHVKENIQRQVAGTTCNIIPLKDLYEKNKRLPIYAGYSPDYEKYKTIIDLKPANDLSGYYLVSVWEEAPFKGNHISYFWNLYMDK